MHYSEILYVKSGPGHVLTLLGRNWENFLVVPDFSMHLCVLQLSIFFQLTLHLILDKISLFLESLIWQSNNVYSYLFLNDDYKSKNCAMNIFSFSFSLFSLRVSICLVFYSIIIFEYMCLNIIVYIIIFQSIITFLSYSHFSY